MKESMEFAVTLSLGEGYRLEADFDMDVPGLAMDEPPPLGKGSAPNPARLLGAAVAGCLSASLAFCLRKSRVDVESVEAELKGTVVRNEEGRWRIGGLAVRLKPVLGGGSDARIGRCLETFEDYCIVTESVRSGIEVDVTVEAPVRRRDRAEAAAVEA